MQEEEVRPWMWIRQFVMGIIGFSSGAMVAGGLFGFIVSLGIISDLADRTKTGKYVLLYENAIVAGGIVGNILYMYELQVCQSAVVLGIFGLISGVFVGCWAMALAEILNVFPIFVRRGKLVRYVPYLILGIALGKGIGGLVYFYMK